MYMDLEEIIYSLKKEQEKEKGLKNRCLYEDIIKNLEELKNRKSTSL